MTLYSYNKDYETRSSFNDELVISPLYSVDKPKKITMVSVFSGFYNSLKSMTTSSKIASIIIPSIFIFAGLGFIYKQLYPEIQQTIAQNNGYLNQGNVSPVSDEYINFEQFISKPSNFAELTTKALDEHVLQTDTASINYRGTFYISIPALGINRIPVSANVDSTSESSYMPVLNYSLAHFRNTGLPISGVENNIVVYGHSISTTYNPDRNNPMVAFTFLPDLKVGDEIIIEMDGQTYKYKMQRSKIVNPNDVSIITGTKGKRTLTLFTCYPAGNNAQRYVAIARPVD